MPDERRTVDLNADVGEAGDHEGIAVERALLGVVSSVHVACGGHAGDDASMRATVLAAQAGAVRIGAHPSYPDRAGFGRRPMAMPAGDLLTALRGQIGALCEVARSLDVDVQSVKAHGALYGEVARGLDSCAVLLEAMAELCDPGTWLVLPARSPAITRAAAAGVAVQREGFCDRAYRADGSLVPRGDAGSVYDDPARAATQALGLARDGTVRAADGRALSLEVDTLCLHGDSPNAVAMARAVRGALDEAGVDVAAPMA